MTNKLQMHKQEEKTQQSCKFFSTNGQMWVDLKIRCEINCSIIEL